MKLKSAIKKAINENSNFKAVKVWDISTIEDYQTDRAEYRTLMIEVQVRKVKP